MLGILANGLKQLWRFLNFKKKLNSFLTNFFPKKGEFETEYYFYKIFYTKWRKLATKRIVDKFQNFEFPTN